MFKKFTLFSFILFLSILLNGCGIYKRADVKDVPVNVNERVKKNIEEGRGVKFGRKNTKGGTFDFASSNELWRASIDVLDFVPFTNASYSGGILITEWFDGNPSENSNRDLKITVRFLTNEIRSDALDINIFLKKCSENLTNCSISKNNTDLVADLNMNILKKATKYQKDKIEKYKKENPYEIGDASKNKRTKDKN